MDICSRLLATLNRYEQFDEQIQTLQPKSMESEERMRALLNEMSQIKESMCSCHDDHQRLLLVFNKLLVQLHNIPMVNDAKDLTENGVKADDCTIDTTNERNADEVEEESKEYFALKDVKDVGSDGEQPKPHTRQNVESELESYDMQVTRSFYAPVLKQLKSKIDPINADMREREMKFLLAKGIDREKILNFDSDVSHESELSDASSDVSDVVVRRQKRKSHQDRYEGSRTMLENKQQFCFLPLANLPANLPSEDILE